MARNAMRCLVVFTWLCAFIPLAHAQYASSTICGTVTREDGSPVADITIQWVQNGHSVSVTSDAAGKFIFRFAIPGEHTLKFSHPSIPETGRYEAHLMPGSALRLLVVLRSVPGNDGDPIEWEIREDGTTEESAWPPERVMTTALLDSMPGTEHLWSLLNHTEASVVAERFDVSGLHSHRQLLLGVRGSSWSQNQASLNGLSVTHVSGDGMLLFPDLSSMEAIVYTVGESPMQHTGPGAHLSFLPKTGGSEFHGQTEMFFQCGALQDTNPSDRHRFFNITESDERWKHFANGGFQLGGAIGRRPWHYFAAVSGRDLKKYIRNQDLPVSARLGNGMFNLSGNVSSRDNVVLYVSSQRVHEPQAGASPQTTREASLDQVRTYYTGQGAWTRSLSSSSILDLRFGISRVDETSRFQPGARGQSQEDLFPGFALAGFPHAPSPWDMLATLNNTVRGPAPLAVSGNAGTTEGNTVYSTVRRGWGHSDHRITVGASIRRMSLTQRYAVVDGVHLLFFEGAPESVRLLEGRTQTRDHVDQFEWHVSDSFTFARLTLTLGLSLDSSRGVNHLSQGKSANSLRWTNFAGRIGAAYRPGEGSRLVLRAGVAQIYDQPLAGTWTAVNPDGIGIRLCSWNDANGDRLFQAGEDGRILKVSGAAYSRLDPKLANPMTTEATLGFTFGQVRGMSLQAFGFHRRARRLITLVNDGVPVTAYVPVQATDPGPDGEVGTGDDGIITAFNQKPETLGRDRYLLTNPDGFDALSEGLEVKLGISTRRFRAQAALTRFRAVASTGPGNRARQNDTNSYLGIYDDPNYAILARGSTYFDRGSLGRLWAAAELPRGIRCSLIISYQDGAPFGRYLPVRGLNQGVVGVLAEQRGPGARGAATGPRTKYSTTADVRVYREFIFPHGRLVALLDIFNLTNRSNSMEETPVTAPTQYWRIPLRFQTPRSLQLGIRYKW